MKENLIIMLLQAVLFILFGIGVLMWDYIFHTASLLTMLIIFCIITYATYIMNKKTK